MKICTIAVILLGLTLPAFSADVAKDPNVFEEGFPRQDQDRISRAAASLVAVYDGVFTDLTPEYAAAMANTGLSPDVYYDPTWDCYSGYPVVEVQGTTVTFAGAPGTYTPVVVVGASEVLDAAGNPVSAEACGIALCFMAEGGQAHGFVRSP